MLYLSPGRFPSARAHSRQAAEMCAAFAACGARVTLAHPDLPARPPAPPRQTLYDYYGLAPTFRTLPLPCPGLPEIFGPEPDLHSRLWRGLAHGSAAAFAIARILREPRREPLVVYSREKYAAYLAPRVARRPDLRVILEVHDLWRPLSRLDRGLMTRAHGIVVIHPALREDLVGEGIPDDAILVEPDGVRDPGEPPSRSVARRALGLDPDDLVVAYTGHLYPSKGVEVLVRAMTEVPDATAVIVGGTRADRERVAAEIRSPNVRLLGHVSPVEAALHQAAADVLVLPTRPLGENATRYTSPLKLAEYRAAGRPVVASDVPSLRAWLTHGETAWLVPPDDPGGLARGLRTLLGDPALRERLARQARRGLENETWEARARRILRFVATRSGPAGTSS